MIKTWGFDFFPASDNLTDSFNRGKAREQAAPETDSAQVVDYFNFYLDLWVAAEAFGFDGVLLSEHHFGGGYSPSPNLLLPLIAQRTTTLRMGVMGMVVPYHNPWRIAEEIGMLDVLTNGRLEVGTSAGIPFELAKVGLTPVEARARYEEALKIIDSAMVNAKISHEGKFWSFNDLALMPRPIQKPEPPKWTTVLSEESARKAARRGSKIATAFISSAKVKQIFDAYNEEAAGAGHPTGPDRLAIRRQVIMELGDSSKDRADEHRNAFRKMMEANVGNQLIKSGSSAKVFDAPAGTHAYSLDQEEFISGSSGEIAAQIIEQCATTGAGHFQATFMGTESREEVRRSWEMFGGEVIPLLKAA